MCAIVLHERESPSPPCSEMAITGGVLLDSEPMSPLDQLRQRWENLNKDQNTKLRLSLNSLEHEQLSPVSAVIFIRIVFFFISLCVLL